MINAFVLIDVEPARIADVRSYDPAELDAAFEGFGD